MTRCAFLATLFIPSAAHAFCGFYVAGADAKLFNDATMVVMMRDGTRTVLAMSNHYKGPPQDFAMVVPVPVVLQKENVKTLPKEVFARVDQLAAPRLVEYWEQDPCRVEAPVELMASGPPSAAPAPSKKADDLGVRIEARFTVGEYNILVLSARDSTGLDTWLKREKYRIPDGAEPILRPYVQGGSKFFVAKVDVKKVRFENGQAQLSPLRFHYDADTFSLPVRLGLVNSSGTQDLIVHILARGQRYELANYTNVTIPTNIDVEEAARGQFGTFYAALFDRTLERHPRAIVTEYSWDANSCDPCPSPPLEPNELATLGADVLANQDPYGFVLTRLHARYGKESLGEDLVFRAAPPIIGGREMMGQDGKLERGAQPSEQNNFQGRYAIRHPWTGKIDCPNPRRGVWGGPPGGGQELVKPAVNTAFAPRNAQLDTFLADDHAELAVSVSEGDHPIGDTFSPVPLPKKGGCASCAVDRGAPAPAAAATAVLAALALVILRRRRSR
jgi:MYXO-CTERM domain-containing protein